MKSPEALQQIYEDLADRYAETGDPRRRDHCLVLAADAALAAGRTDEAERLRQRLLRLNPYHLLQTYTSMSEAVQAPSVQEYVADLRNQLPPDMLEELLHNPPAPDLAFKLLKEPAAPAPEFILKPPPPPPPPPRVAPAPAARQVPRTAVPAAPPPPHATYPVVPAAAPLRKPVAVPKPPAPTRQTASPTAEVPRQRVADQPPAAGRMVATFLFLLALALSGGIFFLAFIRPFLR